MTLLEVSDLRTVFHTDDGAVEAVNGVDLSIEEGEIVGLVGESGSGKSVTARSIMGLISPPGQIESGEIWFDGRNLIDVDEEDWRAIRGNRISMIFQDPQQSLNPLFPIGEQIAESQRAHDKHGEGLDMLERTVLGSVLPRRHPKKRYPKSWARAVELMESTGIPDAADRAKEYPHQFSGGMQQRAMIAQAIACEPDLLVADEPTTALDVTIEAQILELLESLRAEQEMGILLITHDLGVVAETCDRVAVMYAGQIVEQGPVESVFQNPKHPYTYGLLQATPEAHKQKRLAAVDGQVPSLTEMPDQCYFAPRCDYAHDTCYEKNPKMYAVDEGHEARCVLNDEDHPQTFDPTDPKEVEL